MEEIEKRLKDATENCLTAHAEWTKNRKDGTNREKLMESVHELRKVAARLEIEIAISERDEMAAKPIPIPPHRSQHKRRRPEGDDRDDAGNTAGAGGERMPGPPGGGGHGGGHGGGGHGGGGHGGGGHHNRPPRRKLGGGDQQ